MKLPSSIGALELGERPYIVGTVSTWDMLQALDVTGNLPCDMVEVRMDLIGLDMDDWLDRCGDLDASGVPVLLTIRHVSEGGAWSGVEAKRTEWYLDAMDFVSAIDVELSQGDFSLLLPTATDSGTTVIGSFHDFEQTPDPGQLEDLLEQAREVGVDIVKLATLVQSDDDLQALLSLLAQEQDWLSLQAMGDHACEQRIALAQAGSCLVYGYLDESVAPGQVSAQDLRDRMSQ